MFWSENRAEWVVAFWGYLLGGIIVVPIDYRTSPDFLARISLTVAAKLALIGEDVPPLTATLNIPTWKLHELEWCPPLEQDLHQRSPSQLSFVRSRATR